MFSVCWLNWKGRSVSGSNLIWSLYSGPPAFELSQAQPSGIEAGCPYVSLQFSVRLWEMLWEMGVSWVRLVVKALPMCEGRATDCSSWGSQPRRRMLEVKLWRLSVIPISSYWRLSIGLCTKHNSMTMHHLFGYDFNVLDHIEAAFFKAMLPSIKASSAPGCL